jgi:RNA polymerase II elongation factor ELL
MVVNIPDSGFALESSAKAMAGLPMQAFAITLSDSVIEDMIECVQNGQNIQLSLGNSPVSHFTLSPDLYALLCASQ